MKKKGEDDPLYRGGVTDDKGSWSAMGRSTPFEGKLVQKGRGVLFYQVQQRTKVWNFRIREKDIIF